MTYELSIKADNLEELKAFLDRVAGSGAEAPVATAPKAKKEKKTEVTVAESVVAPTPVAEPAQTVEATKDLAAEIVAPVSPTVTFADVKGYVVDTVAAKLRADQTKYVAWSNDIKGEVYAKYRLNMLGDAEKLNGEELAALFTDVKAVSEKYV